MNRTVNIVLLWTTSLALVADLLFVAYLDDGYDVITDRYGKETLYP